MTKQRHDTSKHPLSDHIKQCIDHLEDVETHIKHFRTMHDSHTQTKQSNSTVVTLIVVTIVLAGMISLLL